MPPASLPQRLIRPPTKKSRTPRTSALIDATAWTVLGVGVTILIAIGGSFQKLRNRIDAQGKEISEQMAQLRERMAKLEGLLEGLRKAVTGKRAT